MGTSILIGIVGALLVVVGGVGTWCFIRLNEQEKPEYIRQKVRMKTYWDNVSTIAYKQREKGIKEYGQPIEENAKMDNLERLTMLEEELVDSLIYIEWLKEGMSNGKIK